MNLPVLIGIILAVYTALLIGLGKFGLRIHREAGGFVTADRRLSGWHVFVLITAMWASWMYVTEIDEAYAVGVSAGWFGVAVIVMSLAVVVLFITPFRRLGFVTNSGLLKGAFGSVAGTLSALVIALTFPIFALGNVLAAAAFLHVLLGWPLLLTETLALAVIAVYVALGGLVSLVYTQTANLVVMLVGMLLVAGYVLTHGAIQVPTGAPAEASTLPPAFWGIVGIGIGPVLVWIFSDLVNVVSAQVEFQAITAVDNPRKAQFAVLASSAALLLFVVVPVYLGIATRMGHPGAATGILAYPIWILGRAPLWVRLSATLSIWSAALTWSAPLLFSGASSLGLDVGREGVARTPGLVRRLIRWALPIEALALIAYTALRPGDLAWWTVFGLTLRNGAIFAPTVGLLLWRLGGRRSAVVAMIIGVGAGLLWNGLTGFSPVKFAFGLNPAWLGTAVSIGTFVIGSAIEAGSAGSWQRPGHAYGWIGFITALASAVLLLSSYSAVASLGLAGPLLLTGAIGLELGVISSLRERAVTQYKRALAADEEGAAG